MFEDNNKDQQYLQFARLIVAGKKKEEAYRETVDCEGKSKAAVRSAAHRFAKNDTVVNYIKELREARDKTMVTTLERRMVILSRKAEEAAMRKDRKNLLKAIDMLNRMDGTYGLQKIEIEMRAWRAETEKERRAQAGQLAKSMRDEIARLNILIERAIERQKLDAEYPPPTPENTWHPGTNPGPASSVDGASVDSSTEQPYNEEKD